ncbi:RagB/SusD family nutrient uptake outer membrane protein [Parapedobacter sp. 10938]|uniref:RagB/SusD family nutrient uptake outer membrane protein n=1 Tax=Parapedobacter flavus TaxID=3110225 RepID=UPI002DB6B8C6|nr:RagB/SusD family nutrient uptake outer membrane protein [Parapedobacter sp. 10938]MEC3879326.1 RagB/SusD family nutrient uptake outer membrane protein [Parapedobacter sp. 10938]
MFTVPYDRSTAGNKKGLPTPVSSDVNEQVRRGTLEAMFDHLLSDVKMALMLLDETVDYSRPSTVAANALLARIYLYMGDFTEARAAANSALASHSKLTDYNTEDVRYEDVIYLDFTIGSSVINRRPDAAIDPELYAAYANNDLRKTKFFAMNPDGLPYKLNTHGVGLSYLFTGFDTDELYLIRAECAARLGDAQAAFNDINHLLEHRYVTGTYVPKTDGSADEVLAFVLQERRKEMLYRGVRWSDLRRLNVLGANITLTRQLGEQTFILPPGDARWTLPIPLNEIKTSGIEQNIR